MTSVTLGHILLTVDSAGRFFSRSSKGNHHEQRSSENAGPRPRHQGRQARRHRLRRRRSDRDLRLHRLRHRGRPVLRNGVLPHRRPRHRNAGRLRHARRRLRRPPAGRHHRRPPGRQGGTQARPGHLPDPHGHRHLLHRPAAHLQPGWPAGSGAAGLRPHRPGPGLRRRMGRRHPDELRARTLEVQGQVHRHRPGRLPGGPAAGQPGLPGQREPRRRARLAHPLPRQHRAGGCRPDHPLQGPRVPRLRRGQGPAAPSSSPPSSRSSRPTGATSSRASASASRRPPATPCPSPT